MKSFNWIIFVFTALFALPATAQEDNPKYGETPEQRLKCLEALSIYRSFRDQKNYDQAYITWQTACEVCPPIVSERLYTDGAKFLRKEIKKAYKAKDMERTKLMIDSLMTVYDLRMANFGASAGDPKNECKIKGLKASDMYSYQRKNKLEELNSLFKESIDCTKENTLAGILSGYYISLYDLYKDAEGDAKKKYQQDLLTEYLPLQDYCEYGINNSSKERTVEGYKKAKNNIDEIFVLISNCGDMVPVLEEKIAADPENTDLKKKALRLMNAKDCTEGDMYLQIAEDVHSIEPSAPSAYAIGQGYVKKNELSKSLQYFEEAAELCTDCGDKETFLLKAGQVASAMKRTSTARSYANKILEINPKSGEAFLLIGDAIAGMAASCDDGKLGASSVYWLATDYYNKAKRMDSEVTEKANKKIRSVSGQFPSREILFGYGIKDGDDFTVPCTGEKTTVRER